MYRALVEQHEEILLESGPFESDVEAVAEGIHLVKTQMNCYERCRILNPGRGVISIDDTPHRVYVYGEWSRDAIARLYKTRGVYSIRADYEFFCTHGIPSVNSVYVMNMNECNARARKLLEDMTTRGIQSLHVDLLSSERGIYNDVLGILKEIGIGQKVLRTLFENTLVPRVVVKVSGDLDVFRCMYADSFMRL